MGVCLRTVLLVYLLEVGFLTLLLVDHKSDVRHFTKVVGFMVEEYRR